MRPAYAIAFGTGILLLATRRKSAAASGMFAYPDPVPGGKNLVPIPNMPPAAHRNDLPQALHVYQADFPLTVGDQGSVVTLLGRMLAHRGITADRGTVLTPLTMAALQAQGFTSTDFLTGPLTEAVHISDFQRLATEHPSLVGGLVVHPFKPAEG